jgi:TP901 family phage tail tape measure protein
VADVNANININVDPSDALASLKSLQDRITQFNNSVIKSNTAAVAAQKSLLNTLNAQIGVAGQFSTSIVNVESSVNRLGTAIDKNKLSLGEYFRYGIASTKSFGKVFSQEHNAIMDLAQDRVKRLQTQYIALEKAQNGATKAMAVRPMTLFNADTAIAIQRQQLFNKLLHDGSTSLINFGKNTQWAGRQLMVGFSVPLAAFGAAASKVFMDLDKQSRDFKRVYGDAFTTPEEIDQNLKAIQDLGKEYTKYGIALSDTMNIGATAAAAGMRNDKLTANTEQALRLATVGQIDYQQALTTTITLQNAFKISNEQLAPTVDFIGAVANQTVLSVDDLTAAIPRVAPVIQGLGGDVKDLAVMLVAMKEGGVSAEQGANALKSGLASLINPTKAGAKAAEQYGINIKKIVQVNRGDLMGTVEAFGAALGKLDQFSRQQVLEKVFGKYQFARIGALFDNINNKTGQVKQSMDLLGMSVQDLAAMSDKSLNQIAESTTAKFQSAVEKLKIAIAPIGETFLKVATPVIEFATKLLDKFNELSPGVKQFITILTIGLGAVVPATIMLVGLFANFAGNMIKGLSLVNTLFNKIKSGGSVFKYMTGEELDAAAAASSLEGKTNRLTSALNVQKEAVISLTRAYASYVRGANAAAGGLPQGFRTPRRMATGGIVPGSGNQDSVPALLTPGESVITKSATQKFGPILEAMNQGKIGRFAKGDINIGGGEILNIATGGVKQDAAIQNMVDRALQAGQGVADSLIQILRDMQSAQQVARQEGIELKASAKEVKRAMLDAGMSLKGVSEARYNASSAGIKGGIQQGIAQNPLMNPQQAQQEFARATAAAQEARSEIARYYAQLLENDSLEQSQRMALESERDAALRSATQITRAHTAQLSNFEKTFAEAWDPRLWMPQTESENQLSNILAGSETNRQLYENHLRSIVQDSDQADSIMRKINGNLALTEEELQIQSRVLQDMLATTSTMSRVTGGFAPSAVGAVGAARARASMPGGFFTVDTAELRAQAELTAQMALDETILAWREKWRISSPSRVASDLSEEIPRGVAAGIVEGTPLAVQKAEELMMKIRAAIQEGSKIPITLPPLVGGPSSPLVPGVAGPASGAGGRPNNPGRSASMIKNAGGAITGLGLAATTATFALSGMEGTVGDVANTLIPFTGLLDIGGIAMQMLGSRAAKAAIPVAEVGTEAVIASEGLGSLVAGAEGATGAVGGLAAVANPVGITIAAIAAAVAALVGTFVLAYKNFQQVRDGVSNIGKAFSELFNQISGGSDVFNTFKSIGQKIVAFIKGVFSAAIKAFGVYWTIATKAIEVFIKIIGLLVFAIKATAAAIGKKFAEIKDFILNSTGPIGSTLKGLGDSLYNFFTAIPGFISDFFGKALQTLEDFVNNTIDIINMAIRAAQRLGSTIQEIGHVDITGIVGGGPTPSGAPAPTPTGAGANALAQDGSITIPQESRNDQQRGSRSWLQQLIADTKANMKLFPGLMDQIRNIKGVSIPQAIIDQIGMGEDGLKNATELLKMNKEKLKKLITDYTDSTVASTLSNVQAQIAGKKQQNKAQGILESAGFTKENASSIASDSANAFAIVSAASGKTKTSLLELMKAYKQLDESTREPMQGLKDLMEVEQLQHKQQMKSIDDTIKNYQKQIEIINEEIAAIQRLNDADNDRIKTLERQKEMIQRQIDAKERENELDQRRIESLKREDELRNRVSDKLSHDLEIMSKQETKIKDQYQKRIDALTKISQINEHISNQQKSQLDVAKAFSEGDIYAAAQAANQMSQANAQFAQQQQQEALQQGMNNAVAGLRTGGGLTREQAEQQIAAIKEQSYQTSLQIRDIEDVIYQRNLDMIPLKDQQLSIDSQIQTIKDIIYIRESQISDIQKTRLDPLQQQLAAEQKIKQEKEDAFAALIDSQQALIDQYDLTNAQNDAVAALANNWNNVAQQIVNANKAMKQSLLAIGPAPDPAKYSKADKEKFAKAVEKYNARRAEILSTRDNAVNAAYSSGVSATKKMYMGGMVPKKYANGGHINMDSMLAMLTPGEFVMRKAAVKKYGSNMLSSMNMGAINMPRYNNGGSEMSLPVQSGSNISNISAPVYNTYSINVPVTQPNASADEIANRVIMKIKHIDGSAVRSNRGY